MALAMVPATAAAAAAPTLVSPVNAKEYTTGGTIVFQWAGSLQGDPDTLDRSFFRLEIAKSEDVPAWAQAEWTQVENFANTTAGEAVTEWSIGVPDAGAYRWRVCAWGVQDDLVENTLEQLPNGCSTSRALLAKAPSVSDPVIGTLEIENVEVVELPTREVTETRIIPRDAGPAPERTVVVDAEPAPAGEEVEESSFGLISAAGGDGESAVALASRAGAEGRGGLGGALAGALGSTIPGVPIPFWTLLLLAAVLPVVARWRRDVVGMFDWSDGSVDGSGTPPPGDELPDGLHSAQHAEGVKVPVSAADSSSVATTREPSAPARRDAA